LLRHRKGGVGVFRLFHISALIASAGLNQVPFR